MTQEELADKLHYKSKTTIAKIENGTNDIVQSKVVEFAKALRTSPAYLMGLIDISEQNKPTVDELQKFKDAVFPIHLKKFPLLGEIACGEPITHSSYVKMWERIRKAISDVTGEPCDLTAHIFRHNYCTQLCYQIPTVSIKRIAQLLGDTESMVLNVYNHIMLEKEDSAGAINAAL